MRNECSGCGKLHFPRVPKPNSIVVDTFSSLEHVVLERRSQFKSVLVPEFMDAICKSYKNNTFQVSRTLKGKQEPYIIYDRFVVHRSTVCLCRS